MKERLRFNISHLSWLLIGLIFVISAVSKGLDPISFCLKVREYLDILGIEINFVLIQGASISLIAIELAIGLIMLSGIGRLFIFPVVCLISLSFLILTLWSATSSPIDDCGCLGAISKISPWISFLKNLLIFLLLVFSAPYVRIKRPTNNDTTIVLSIVTVTALYVITIINLHPAIDKSNIKVGMSVNTTYPDLPNFLDLEYFIGEPLSSNDVIVVVNNDRKIFNKEFIGRTNKACSSYRIHPLYVTNASRNALRSFSKNNIRVANADISFIKSFTSNYCIIIIKNNIIIEKQFPPIVEINGFMPLFIVTRITNTIFHSIIIFFVLSFCIFLVHRNYSVAAEKRIKSRHNF